MRLFLVIPASFLLCTTLFSMQKKASDYDAVFKILNSSKQVVLTSQVLSATNKRHNEILVPMDSKIINVWLPGGCAIQIATSAGIFEIETKREKVNHEYMLTRVNLIKYLVKEVNSKYERDWLCMQNIPFKTLMQIHARVNDDGSVQIAEGQ